MVKVKVKGVVNVVSFWYVYNHTKSFSIIRIRINLVLNSLKSLFLYCYIERAECDE